MRFSSWSDGERRLGELRMAVRFLTRLPLDAPAQPEPPMLARAAWAFPVVGCGVGLVCGVVWLAADGLRFPPLAAALLAVAAGIFATGALHEDGLADTADGLGGGTDAAEKLAIMRDSRSGAYGVLALVFTVGLRAAAAASLPAGLGFAAFIAAHAVGRGGLPAAMFLMEPARLDGLGAGAGRPELGEALAALLIAAAVALVALGLRGGFAALFVAAAAMAAVATLAERQIGGHTGDVLGAIEQGGETVVLLAAAAWAL